MTFCVIFLHAAHGFDCTRITIQQVRKSPPNERSLSKCDSKSQVTTRNFPEFLDIPRFPKAIRMGSGQGR
ncbi:hypothetical protein BaRGS_00039474, partial [Batillaria attramentaria]